MTRVFRPRLSPPSQFASRALAIATLLVACNDPRNASTQDHSDASRLPRQYTALRALTPVVIDGRLDDPAWRAAAWSEPFADIEGLDRTPPTHPTHMKIAWDDRHLYIAAELVEPNVWATLTRRDEIVFHDNDFEVFIDPDGDGRNYYEIETNARGTLFDLLLVRTYRAGGPARHDWNLDGLRAANLVDGTLNNPTDVDRAWTVEFALPWEALAEYSKQACPPRPGDRWRMNFSRVEWDVEVRYGRTVKISNRPEHNWVWSPQGVVDMHLPERWGWVVFRD